VEHDARGKWCKGSTQVVRLGQVNAQAQGMVGGIAVDKGASTNQLADRNNFDTD